MSKTVERDKSDASDARICQLLQELRELWKVRQTEINEQWVRTLPFADYVVDRWEKARILGFGKRSSIYDSSIVIGDVNVDEHTWIGPFTLLDGSGGLTIGSYCSISTGVQIYSHDTTKWAISGGTAPYEYAPTTIENNCYIGPNTIISKGVTIGEGSIIGANSYVDHSWPKGSRIAGNPADSIR